MSGGAGISTRSGRGATAAAPIIVGREVELEVIEGLLSSVGSGTGAVVLLTGEAGIGKSHLAAEIRRRAEARGFDAAVGRCFPDPGQRSFAAYREALGDAAVDGPSRRAALGTGDERARSFEQVLDAVRGRPRPLLLVVEDLHWADGDAAGLFLHLARFALDGPLLLVGTVRAPDLDAAANTALDALRAELVASARVHRLALRPLELDDVLAVAASIVGGEVPQSLGRTLVAETAGNPLYVREIVRWLVDTRGITLHDGRAATDFAGDALALPPSVRDVVRRRLSRLSAGAAALVRSAAALGGPAELATLAPAAGSSVDGALDALDEALASGLLRSVGPRYELAHAIVGRAVYEELNPDRRMRLHRALAAALEAVGGDAAVIAAQYAASRDLPGAEAGVAHALAAAAAARAAGAPGRAAQILQMAATLCERAEAATRTEVLSRLAVVRAEALDAAGALDAVEATAALLAAPGCETALASLLGEVASALEAAGAPRAQFGPLVTRGLAVLGARRDLVWARLAMLARGPVPLLSGPVFVGCFPGHDADAVRLLREGGSERDFAATVDPHDHRTATEGRALRARALSFADPVAAIRVRDAYARDVFFRGHDFAAAAAEMEGVLALAARAGSLAGQGTAHVVLACCQAALGDFQAARASIARGREIALRLGSMHRMNRIGPFAAEASLGIFQGADWPEVTAPLLAFLSSPGAGSTPFGIVALNLGTVGCALAGDAAGVERLLPLLRRALEGMPSSFNEWGAGRDCGATAVWEADARAHAPAFLALAERAPPDAGVACWSSAAHSEARLRALTGDLDGARRAFDQARADFDASGRRPARAICDHDEALAFVRNGRADDPRVDPLLTAAAAAFATLGMTTWTDRVRALRAGAASPAAPDGLTPREVEVLRLLAAGLANKEIAARLFISVATVERHVANVYAKIGLAPGARGRVAAAAYARRKGLGPD